MTTTATPVSPTAAAGKASAPAATAHVDTFVRDRLPAPDAQPELRFDLPELRALPARLNCATWLLDRRIDELGDGGRRCIVSSAGVVWTYAELREKADRIAHVLVRDLGLVPGNRVLLRAPNTPMLAACWFAVMKAGGIAVATMPLLRAKEVGTIVRKAQATHAICDAALAAELDLAAPQCPTLRSTLLFGVDAATANAADRDHALEPRMQAHAASGRFANVDTAVDDPCLVAFTSGTTGEPKGTVHAHRDVVAACLCWPPHMLRACAEDLFTGSPPLAFTFGLGGLLLFPLSIGAATLLVERPAPANLLQAIAQHRATVLFTAPTSYRGMAEQAKALKLSAPLGGSLRKCVSAGEVLPAATRRLWRDATGLNMIDGIGATEMLHIFISADEAEARDGYTGRAVPGYRAEIHDDDGRPLPPNTVGRLAVKGPTGCRYLDDPRQANYVKGGWNYTGDAYEMTPDGFFRYHARTDDMIVSAGYNIAAPEVEDALMSHPAVAECAVIGAPDQERGQIVKAYVVLRAGHAPGDAMAKALQDHVKATVAPYKYPRAVEFRETLPRTQTGKLQRFVLRDEAQASQPQATTKGST